MDKNMKRHISFTILMTLLIQCLLLSNIPAVETVSAAKQNLLIDEAGLYSNEDANYLERRLQTFYKKNQFAVVLLFVPSLQGKTPEAYAADYYNTKKLGEGPGQRGMLHLYSPEAGQSFTYISGSEKDAFSQKTLTKLNKLIPAGIAAGDYFQCVDQYLNRVKTTLRKQAEKESPAVVNANKAVNSQESNNEKNAPSFWSSINWLIVALTTVASFFIGLLISSIANVRAKKKMLTTKPEQYADQNRKGDSLQLSVSEDILLYTTVNKKN